jgi:solute carrier family 13 (sodium-dependent dicarboxylate transporter), member 2/3/5
MSEPPSLVSRLGLWAGPILFLLIYWLGPPADLSPEGNAILAGTVWIALWWITEAIPIEATALLPIPLLALSSGLDTGTITASYGHPMVFLYLGGFLVALGIERWNLHRRIALNIIWLIGTRPRQILLGFMLATAFLSMWISNTATSLMMLPIGLAIVRQMIPEGQESQSSFAKALMLAIAYSASVGGMATLIGTPPNAVFASVVQETLGQKIPFVTWMSFALPFSMAMVMICWAYLSYGAFSLGHLEEGGGRSEIQRQLQALGPMQGPEARVLVVFALTALAWITRSWLLNRLVPDLDDTHIAIGAGLVLFIIPARGKGGERLMAWKDTLRLPWGILLLFGGGLALAKSFQETGLAIWLGEGLTNLQGLPFFFLLLIVVAMVNFLTEVTSNLATASMILPILAALAQAIGVHPYGLMIGATLAASCAFMLPVATPPNAVVFGSGVLRMRDMVRAGLVMNLTSIVLIGVYTYLLLPLIWGVEL